MMEATFNGNHSTTIISYYNPTNASEEMDPNAMYKEISSLFRSISKHTLLNFSGDMNAKRS